MRPSLAVVPARALDRVGFVALLGLLAAVLLAAARQLGDFDLPWHLSLGRAAVTHLALPYTDDFSYTFAGQRAPDEFLADSLLYLAVRAAGPVGLQLLSLACVGLLGWLLVLRARPAPLALPFAALTLWAASPWLVVRPALFSFVALAALLFLLDRHRVTGRGLIWLVPLELVWANLHPFATLGAPLVFAYAGYVALCNLGGERFPRWLPATEGHRPGRVMALAGATFAVSFLSPFGARLYTASWAMAGSSLAGVRALITEWTPTTLSFLWRYDPAALLLGLLCLVGLVSSRRATAWDLGLLALGILLSARAVRLLPLGALFAGPLAARHLSALAGRAQRLLAVVISLAAPLAIAATPGARLGFGFDEANLPVGATRFLASHRPAGAVWNFLPFGGWLTWRLYPEVRVFIDGRTAHLYSPRFTEEAARAEHDPATFARLSERYDFQWAVVRARPGERFSTPIARDRRWTMIYLDDCAAIYVRADGPNRSLAQEGYQELRHIFPSGRLAPPLPAAWRHDAALALQQAPHSLRARTLAAAAGLRSP